MSMDDSTDSSYESSEHQGLSAAAKWRVDNTVDSLPAGRHCVVTHSPFALEYCHILPRDPSTTLVNQLEYSWGMKFGGLWIDNRWNLIKLDASLSSLFECDKWILLPEEEVIQALLQRATSNHRDEDFRDFIKERNTYTYKLIAGSNLRAYLISRYKNDIPAGQAAGPDDFDKPYFYPFEDLPSITSHVQPHFVICNIGLKMQKRSFDKDFFGPDSLVRQYEPLMRDACTLFKHWTRAIPEGSGFYDDPEPPRTRDDDI